MTDWIPRRSASADLLGVLNADPERRYRLLLAIADSISVPRELPQLLEHLGGLLRQALAYDFVAVLLHDPETGITRLLSIESRLPTRLRLVQRPVRVGHATDVHLDTSAVRTAPQLASG